MTGLDPDALLNKIEVHITGLPDTLTTGTKCMAVPAVIMVTYSCHYPVNGLGSLEVECSWGSILAVKEGCVPGL